MRWCQEQQRQQLDEERNAIAAQLRAEKEDVSSKLTAEIDELRAEIAAVLRDRDDQLLVAETDRQQVNARSFPLR